VFHQKKILPPALHTQQWWASDLANYRGFASGNTYWMEHDEYKEFVHNGHPIFEEDQRNNVTVEGHDMTSINDVDDDLDEMFHNVDAEFTSRGQSQKFSQMMMRHQCFRGVERTQQVACCTNTVINECYQ
jgi:hypothetical protein